MLRLNPKPNATVSQRQLFHFLRQLVPKEHWNNFNENARQLENDQLIVNELQSRLLIARVMGNCNRILDFYGPIDYLVDDVKRFFGVHMPLGKHYKFPCPFAGLPKLDVFRSFFLAWFKSPCNFAALLEESLCSETERQLLGTYEMIPYEDYLKDFTKWMNTSAREKDKKSHAIRIGDMECSWTGTESEEFFVLEFFKIFDSEHDKHLIPRLRRSLLQCREHMKTIGTSSAGIANALFLTYKNLKMSKLLIEDFIEKYPYYFLPFVESERIMGADFPAEPPLIRLMTMGDDKILFAKDVENAVRRVMKNQNRHPDVLRRVLDVETEEDLRKEVYRTILHTDYFKVLEKLQLKPESITLVETSLLRCRHLIAPIYSPYGKKCKPAVDVFYELLNILTIDMAIWQRIKPNQMKELEAKIEKVCAMFMDPTKSRYFIECSRIEQLAEHLRAELSSLLAALPKIEKSPSLPHFAEDYTCFSTSPFLMALARMGVMDLRSIYPQLDKQVLLVYAKNCTNRLKPSLSKLEVLMAIRDCLAACLADHVPLIGRFLCSQKHCQQFSAYECVCPLTEAVADNRNMYTPAVVASEDDYSLKFDCFDDNGFGILYSLISKKTGEKLVLGDQWGYGLLELLKAMEPKYQERFDCPTIRKMLLESKDKVLFPYFMSSDEMCQLTKVPMQRLKEKYEIVTKEFKDIQVGLNSEGMSQSRSNFSTFISHVVSECIDSISERAVDNTTLGEFLPNRKFYLQMIRYGVDGRGTELCVHSGDLFHAVKLLLNQNRAIIGKNWGLISNLFNQMVCSSINNDGWTFKPVRNAVEILEMFPINPGRFCFVPELDYIFWNFTRKASEVIAEVRAEEKRQYREEQKALEKKLKQEKKMAKAAEKEEKKQKKKAEKLERRAAIEEPDVAEPEQENAEEPENLLVELRKKMEEFDELTMKLRDSDEKREKLKKADADRKKELGQMKQQMSAKEKTNQELQQEIEKSTKKHSQLASAKGREIQEMKLRFEREAAEKKTQYDKLQNENRALHEALRIGKLREEAIEKECAEKVEEILSTAGNFDQLRADFARVFDDKNRLASQNQFLMNMLQGNYESVRRLHEEQCAQLQFFNSQASLATPIFFPATLSSSESSSVTASDALSPQQHELIRNLQPRQRKPPTIAAPPPPPPECGICLNSMTSTSETITCEVCTTKWHAPCIEEWLTKKATCPVCNRSLPSPSHFPPIQ